VAAKRRRIAAFLVLANYVLALTVGGVFHVHDDHRCAAAGAPCASPCPHEAPAPHGCCGSPRADRCEPEGTATEGTASLSRGSEKCPVCQFLAQKPVPVRPVEAVACAELLDNWAPVHPLPRADHTSSTHLIRGPPAVA
jgi:hypothetical protein